MMIGCKLQVKIPQEQYDELLEQAALYGLSPAGLIEAFVCDLTTDGYSSDTWYLINQWYETIHEKFCTEDDSLIRHLADHSCVGVFVDTYGDYTYYQEQIALVRKELNGALKNPEQLIEMRKAGKDGFFTAYGYHQIKSPELYVRLLKEEISSLEDDIKDCTDELLYFIQEFDPDCTDITKYAGEIEEYMREGHGEEYYD